MRSEITAQAKRAALALIARTVGVPYWKILVRDVAVVFMMHRFADRERGIPGVTADNLRANLSFLRSRGFRLASFWELPSGSASAERSKGPLVLFTVDDGHAEFASVAAPVFAEFDCPVTVFVTTGPIDSPVWFWWDKADYAVMTTRLSGVRLEIGEHVQEWRWRTPEHRARAVAEITERLKAVPNEVKLQALIALAERLEVALPSTPPPRYAAMSWADVRRCAAAGVTFGPHTVTHPMLSQISESQAEWEIRESWNRLRAECDATVPVFCYPNGVFSQRDVRILQRTDLVAAVTTRASYTSRNLADASAAESRFSLPRFNYATDRAEFISIVTGVDRVSSLLRSGRAGWRAVGGADIPALR